ncbi:SPOR domain-containing protein [Ancylomarina longa]|uniref:SPOR domain-containing protein n=1 Tax=Ancylomarina longa TaxID=2487017 RepID=A0A434AUG7_9BACT|nr:SPOR domain-containing protein [Ancylomarina longa]RUT77986.1 hypothetical protein DLK05_10060 [Ancylomarina longa]
MLEVSKYISDLLFIHDCVILPGFGGFVANYQPAEIDENQSLFLPPKKAIGFNRNLTQNDGLLIHRVADSENLSYVEAEKSVRFFIEDISVRIQRGEKVSIDKVGVFYNDRRYNLQFEPSKNLNYLAEAFGLEQIKIPQLSSSVPEILLTDKKKIKLLFSEKRLRYAAVILPFALAIALIPMSSVNLPNLSSASMSWFQNDNKVLLEKTAPSTQISPPEEYVRFEPKLSESIVKAKLPVKGKYYLIAGSFTSLNNAEILRKELISRAYPASIIRNKNLYSVAINQFENRFEVDLFKKKVIAKNPKSFCWILKK